MLELKIQCAGCDQKYKFDVEPVHGRMPWTVQCPICRADGTETANTALAQSPVVAGEAPISVRSPGTMRISPTAAAPAISQQTLSAPPAVPELPPLAPARPARSVAPGVHSAGSNFGLGVAGAVAGALLGMVGWYLLIRLTHHTIGYAAIGVGALAGWGARSLGKQSSHALGIVAAISGVLAILLGQFLAIRSLTAAQIAKTVEGSYDEHMIYAKEAVKAKSDEEIKAVLIKSEGEDAANAAGINARAIQNFRQTEQPILQKFVNGSPGKADFQREQQSRIEEATGPLVLKESFGLMTILWIFLGVGSAYRVANRT